VIALNIHKIHTWSKIYKQNKEIVLKMKSFLMLAIPGKHQPNALHEFMSPLHTKVKAHTSKYNRSSLEYIVFPFCLIVSRTNQY